MVPVRCISRLHRLKVDFQDENPFITERLLMGRKESNQTKQTNKMKTLKIFLSETTRHRIEP